MNSSNKKLAIWGVVITACVIFLAVAGYFLVRLGTPAAKTFHVASEATEAVDKAKKTPKTKKAETTVSDTTDAPTEPVTEPVTEPATEPVTEPPYYEPETEPQYVETTPAPGPVNPIPDNYNESYYNAVVAKAGSAPAGYLDSMVFLGDSTTYGLGAYKVLDWKQVWVPSNGTLTLSGVTADTPLYDDTVGYERTLGEMCRSIKPKYLVITLGVNGMTFLDDASFKNYYSKVIDRIQQNSPGTTILCQSIYPLCASCSVGESFNNNTVQHANSLIVEVAYAYGLTYLDTYHAIVASDGYRPESYSNGDGLHFSPAGFDAILNYIESHPAR